DGTIFAGISPDTGKPMYTTPEDAPLTYTFDQAKKYASRLDSHGHHDWHVPTKAELNMLFNNRAAIGGFDASHYNPGARYWAFMQYRSSTHAWTQRFNDGDQRWLDANQFLPLRCVRREP